MPHFIPNAVLDAKLALVTANATRVYACSGQPSDFAGIAALALGSYVISSANFTAPADNAGPQGGRSVTFASTPLTGNNATATGEANHLAFVDDSVGGSEELLQVVPCNTQQLTSGQPFTIGASILNENDPVAYVPA